MVNMRLQLIGDCKVGEVDLLGNANVSADTVQNIIYMYIVEDAGA